MLRVLDVLLELTIPTFILLHLYISPYTKVEESFNLQAIHDIIHFGIPNPLSDGAKSYIQQHYDHVAFPGSVPRTFVGAIILAGLTKPFTRICTSPQQLQLIARGVLGLINAWVLIRFKSAVDVTFGRTAGRFYICFLASQFHVIYYASRTLPNMLALPLTTEAMRAMFLSISLPISRKRASHNLQLTIYLLAASAIIFRAEIAILLLTTVTTFACFKPNIKISDVFKPLLIAGFTALPLTLALDTFLWSPRISNIFQFRTSTNSPTYNLSLPIWPELTGFVYNTVQGHSSEWGTSPWYFYFASSLPRLLINPILPLFCIPTAFLIPSLRRKSFFILLPNIMFIAIYSALPHKEWRFIIYCLPPLTAVASAGAAYHFNRVNKSIFGHLFTLLILFSIPASFLVSTSVLFLSTMNYPGGTALSNLHSLASTNSPSSRHIIEALKTKGHVKVYLDNLSLQTGITRFQETFRDDHAPYYQKVSGGWYYDKTENETILSSRDFWNDVDFIIAEDSLSLHPGLTEREKHKEGKKWEVVAKTEGLVGVGIRLDDNDDEDRESGLGLFSWKDAKQRRIIYPPLPISLPSMKIPLAFGLRLEKVVSYDQLCRVFIEHFVTKFTRGYWPHIKVKTKLLILKRKR